jgi:hypothetical protein
MTYQYLLDTNIISDLVKQPQGLVFQRIATVGETSICTSILWRVSCDVVQLKVAPPSYSATRTHLGSVAYFVSGASIELVAVNGE